MKYYLDNAATTPLCEEAKRVIIDNLDTFGNPSSKHSLGRAVRHKIEDARKRIAEEINANPNEIFFTSGASESNSWILHGFGSILTTATEHHSVLNAVSKSKYVDYICCTLQGIDMNDMIEKLTLNQYRCVTIQHVNNELGYINNIKEIRRIVPKHTLLHVDATQSIPHMKINVKSLDVDAMSFSGHKFGAMKGVGVLYVKHKWQSALWNLISGGSQERDMRGGTENVLGILSMDAALSARNLDSFEPQLTAFREIMDKVDGITYNTSYEDSCTTGIISLTIGGIESESLMLLLEMEDIFVSAGSACAGSGEISHVLKAVGMTDERARGTIRISMSHDIRPIDMTYVANRLINKIGILRKFT